MSLRSARYAIVAAALCIAPPAFAQTAASDHIARGDSAYAAMKSADALKHYEAALAVDSTNDEALWKASRSAIDLGEATADKAQRQAYYTRGEQYARRAVAANPSDAEGHFHLARSLGRTALSLGVRDRIKYAKDIRTQALEALKTNPRHPGALHVMGMWNAEVMRLNGLSRFMAKNFLGGKVFGTASWDDAVRYMEQSVAVEPNRIVHRVDLAEIYRDVGNKAKAREQAEFVAKAPPTDPNDDIYKRQAEQLLASLK
jgi:tetratricopeptide (TPR) repeat protein